MIRPTTIASVTFEGDLRLTVLQALSIDRLFKLGEVYEYVIVLNGKDNKSLREMLDRHLTGRISSELQQIIRLVSVDELPRAGGGAGWHGQQAIKLALADIVTTDTYLLLDAKNHFVRPSCMNDFFEGTKPKTYISPTSPYWEKYVRASLEALDAFTSERFSEMMPTTTPYLMITDEVLALIDRLEEQFGSELLQAMRSTVWGTEFFLYYSHLVSAYDDLPYVHAPPTTRTLYTSWPQDDSVVLSTIADTTEQNVPVFGLHRNRLPQLTSEQRLAIEHLWSRHLLADWENSDWFLTSVN